MKKRITAFLVAITFLFTATVFSAYYPEDIPRADIPFSEMLEHKFDFEGSLELLYEAEKKLQEGAEPEEIFALLDKALPTDSIDYMTRCNLDNLVASIDNTESNSKRLTESENSALDIHKLSLGLTKSLFENPRYKDAFIKYMESTEDEIREMISSIPTDEEYEIQKELNLLSERYYGSTFGTHEMELDGEMYDFAELSSLPPEVYNANLERYLSESCDKLSKIFIAIVEKRIELSKAAGFDSYIDYTYTEEYPKDYSSYDRQSFYDNTAKYIIPLYSTLYSIGSVFTSDGEIPDLDLSDDELLASFRSSLEKINPELTVGFDYMIKYGLYDISTSDNKRPGGFTTNLEYFGVPFLYNNPGGSQSENLSALAHEYGHFNAFFHSPLEYSTEPNLDISEIHSQGLELLMMKDYGRYYKSEAAYHRYTGLMYMLNSVIYASVYSMWLEDVYTAARTTKLSKELLCSKYLDVWKKLDPNGVFPYTVYDSEWMLVPHNFEVPFYYISYGVSALASLELFSEYVKSPESAVDRYMKLSAKGSSVPFSETLSECGFSNPFADSTFHNVCKTVMEYTGTGFTDVSPTDWFFPYVVKTAYFLDGTSPDKFSPDSPASRLTFVEAIGRMEEDVNGIEAQKPAFSDTDSTYIAWAKNNGVASGITDDEFSPQSHLTREMAVCFLHRLAGSPDTKSQPQFSDMDAVSPWALEAVSWAADTGIINGYTDGTFRPQTPVTLGETAKLIADTYKTNYKGE